MSQILATEIDRNVLIVTPLRRISDLKDEHVDDDLRKLLDMLDRAQQPMRVLVDFSNVMSFGTGMMHVLIMLHKKIGEDNRPLAVCNLSDACGAILNTARFDILCATYHSRQEALLALRSENVNRNEDSPSNRHFTIEERGGVTVVYPVDAQLSDLALHGEFRDELLQFIDQRRPTQLLVNFAAVQYATTGVVETLLQAKRKLEKDKGHLKLCELSQFVHETFRALNLIGTVFYVYNTEAEALYAFTQEAHG
jgi:anti-anti-sigma regulatory factor